MAAKLAKLALAFRRRATLICQALAHELSKYNVRPSPDSVGLKFEVESNSSNEMFVTPNAAVRSERVSCARYQWSVKRRAK